MADMFSLMQRCFPTIPPPADGEAQVWLAWTNRFIHAEMLDMCRDLLVEEEREKCKKFYFEQDRHLYLVAHAMLRFVLAAYLHIEPRQLELSTNAYGRPEVIRRPGMRDIRFNLSHTRDLAALVVNCNVACGIDVEARREFGNISDMADYCLSSEEQDIVGKLPKPERDWAFLRIWTLKEAYIKALGKGLSLPLNRFSFTIDGEIAIRFHSGIADAPLNWQFSQTFPGPDHILALAFRINGEPNFNLGFREWLPV